MSKNRILIIDDDPMVSNLLKEHLTNEGFEVITSHLAEQGFLLAVASPPNLILLDVMLPDATGYQMIGKFRQDPLTKAIPIIMMTGTARNSNQQQIAKNMGANDYVLKPFDVIDLGERVKRLINGQAVEYASSPDTPESPKLRAQIPPEHDKPIAHSDSQSRFAELPPATPARKNPTVPWEVLPPEEPPAWLPTDFDEKKPKRWMPRDDSPAERLPLEQPVLPDFDRPPTFYPMSGSEGSVFAGAKYGWKLTGILLIVHLVIISAEAESDKLRNVGAVAGDWMFLLGLIVTSCAIVGMDLAASEALSALGWAMLPLVIRSGAFLLRVTSTFQLPPLVAWLRPLDAYELVSLFLIGLILGLRHRGSILKSLVAILLVAVGWSLLPLGYFRTF